MIEEWLNKNMTKKCLWLLMILCLAVIHVQAFALGSQTGNYSDYSDEANWLRLPDVIKKVDTFYLYPAAYNDGSEGASDICTIDNEEMRQQAEIFYEQQGTAYEESTNVFAPYYRQVNMAAVSGRTEEYLNSLIQEISKEDVFAALDQYFENLNGGRPFILAGHAQSSMLLTWVLSEYMSEHPDYYERMVAAYLPGYPITEQFLQENPHLKFAENAYDTGVIISWNTLGEGSLGQPDEVIMEGVLSINPLNWERDETYAETGEHLGARVWNEDIGEYEIIPEAADAWIDPERGVLVTHIDDIRFIDDYLLWYNNIANNAARRIAYFLAEITGRIVDYSDPDNWYQIPEITKEVDTFFIYPTVFIDMNEKAPDYAGLYDPVVRSAIKQYYDLQACVFEESTNVFMPYYQQANMKIEIAVHEQDGDLTDALYGEYPHQDIFSALDYYFENYNNGRPFIIAGHSQGAALVRLALKQYFNEHPDYYERMIAAYVLGYSVTQNDLDQNPWLRFAQGADDTGVIVSWNTEGPGNNDADNMVVLDGAISINPLNWKLDDTYASADENLGSRIFDEETKEPEIMDIRADAQVDTERGVVICTTTEVPFISMEHYKGVPEVFGSESFHNGDYPFYFNNIKENIRIRIDAWNNK